MYIPAIVLGLVILLYEISKCRIEKKVYLFASYVVMLALINLFGVKNINFSFIIKFLCEYLPVSIWLLCRRSIHKRYWISISIIIALATAISWFSSPDNYSIMNNRFSRNYVSIFLLISIFIITYLYENLGENVPIWVPITYLILSILAIGRGGILASIIYCMLYYVVDLKKNSKYTSLKLVLAFIGFILLIVFFLLEYDTIMNMFFSRFVDSSALNSNNGRMRLYLLYISKMLHSFSSFFFGVRITEISKILPFIEGNLHCSFLQVHASFGILGIVGVIYYLKNCFQYLFKINHYYEIIFLIVFLFRIATDFALCGFVTDIILIYYMILPVIGRKSNHARII